MQSSRLKHLLLTSDIVVFVLSWLLAWYFRFSYLSGHPGDLVKNGPTIFLIWLIFLLYFMFKEGLYISETWQSMPKTMVRTIKSSVHAFGASIFFIYFLFSLTHSRIFLLTHFLVCTLLLVLVRILVHNYISKKMPHTRDLRLVLVGNGQNLKKLYEQFATKKTLFEVVAHIDVMGTEPTEDLEKKIRLLLASQPVEGLQIALGYSDDRNRKMTDLIDKFNNDIYPIKVVTELGLGLVGYTIDDIEGVPTITLNKPKLSKTQMLGKRLLDILGSGLGLLALSPLFIILGLIIKATSKGPIFYSQERMGLDGYKFKMWKFRSMRVSDNNTPGWTTANDDRRTPIGKFLRATSIDELPQLWNVFVGDMSLVGPRPEQPFFVEKFRAEIPGYMLRHKMRAGITGWAQINGWRGDTSIEKRIECDLYYIRNWSLAFDIKILVLTIIKGFINENAY